MALESFRQILLVASFAAWGIMGISCSATPSQRRGGEENPNLSDASAVMLSIPAGSFEMGSSLDEIEAALTRYGLTRRSMLEPETPRHRVVVEAFQLSACPVTNADFQLFLKSNPAWRPGAIPDRLHNGNYLAHWPDGEFPEDFANVPVVNVSWYAAEAYCRWLGGHLPTEIQWEWAARGGLDAPEFPWGESEPTSELANWAGDSIDHAVTVGSYPPNGYGLYDMAGNVWQFCLDEWKEEAYLQRSRSFDPISESREFLEIVTRRVIRGGSWGAAAVNMRVTFRDSHPPEGAGDHVGFRCAR